VPKRPGAQSEHDAEPAAAHVPGRQWMQILFDKYIPPGQLAHTVERDVSDDVAPGRAYLPVGHETSPEQLLEVSPVVEPYFPAGQS